MMYFKFRKTSTDYFRDKQIFKIHANIPINTINREYTKNRIIFPICVKMLSIIKNKNTRINSNTRGWVTIWNILSTRFGLRLGSEFGSLTFSLFVSSF